jgi:class 3 adenylate cyclase/pimeloyl-ACP methyl ester carboxylesterase
MRMTHGPPETMYVESGEADVAYTVVGDGPLDLLYFYGLGSHVDLIWDDPLAVRFLDRLASFSRLIFFDRRGTGASDGVARSAIPTLEEWTEDVGAVLDAVGSDRAAIFAALDAGPIAMLFAAMRPERVSTLVLANTSARYLVAEDYPIGMSQNAVDALVEMVGSLWGTPELAHVINPGHAHDTVFAQALARRLRAAATPRTATAQYRYLLGSVDVRSALPLIQAPTLVLHMTQNPVVPFAYGRYLADHIAGAKFVEVPGRGIGWDDGGSDTMVDEVAEFLTGQRPVVEIDRVLTTVLFTDIVGSTERAASLGDHRWRTLLDSHDRAVRELLRRFRGQEIKTTGDGFHATFDGPARAIRCARAIADAARELGIEVRAGLHTGECEIHGNDLAGLAVHIAARVGALAEPGEVLVSSTVKDLVVGSGIDFADRGEHQLKGVPMSWRLFNVRD